MEYFVEVRRMKHALGPQKWEELKAELQQFSEGTRNLTFFSDDSDQTCRVANELDGRRIEFRYDPDAECIFYEGPRKKGAYAFSVSANQSSIMFTEGGKFIHISEIVFNSIRQINP